MQKNLKIEQERTKLILNKAKAKMNNASHVGCGGQGSYQGAAGSQQSGQPKIKAMKSSNIGKITCEDTNMENNDHTPENHKNTLSVADQTNVSILPEEKLSTLEDPSPFDFERNRQLSIERENIARKKREEYFQQQQMFGMPFMNNNYQHLHGGHNGQVGPTQATQATQPTQPIISSPNSNFNSNFSNQVSPIHQQPSVQQPPVQQPHQQPKLEKIEIPPFKSSANLVKNEKMLNGNLPVLKPDDLNVLEQPVNSMSNNSNRNCSFDIFPGNLPNDTNINTNTNERNPPFSTNVVQTRPNNFNTSPRQAQNPLNSSQVSPQNQTPMQNLQAAQAQAALQAQFHSAQVQAFLSFNHPVNYSNFTQMDAQALMHGNIGGFPSPFLPGMGGNLPFSQVAQAQAQAQAIQAQNYNNAQCVARQIQEQADRDRLNYMKSQEGNQNG